MAGSLRLRSYTRYSPRHPNGGGPIAVLALVIAGLLTGCMDAVVGSEDVVERPAAIEDAGTKLRHGHLLDRAVKAGGSKSASTEALGLLVAVQSGVDKQRVVDRYRINNRYRVSHRFSYDYVFEGFAWTVEDTTGLNDYYAFLDTLLADPDILWFEPDFDVLLPPSNAAVGTKGQMVPWSVAAIGGMNSWAVSGDGQGSVNVDVYVLDTGISHNDVNVVENLDFRDSTLALDPSDYDGHGTHVAGILGAVDDNDGLVGVAPGARVHNLKVLDDDGTGDVSMVIAAVEYLTAQKVANPSTPMVVNLSLGEDVGTTAYTAMDEAIQASVAAGVVYVVAAGNHAKDASQITPAHVDEVITVGSYGVAGGFSWFSNYGPQVDILAPGEDIVSLGGANGGGASLLSGTQGSDIMLMSGTSMSTAHVSGAAALYLGLNPSATPAQVEQALVNAGESFVFGAPAQTTTKSVWVGQQPMSPGPNGALLFVVPDATVLTDQDVAKQSFFEAWGYTVTLISADESQSAFDAATALVDVAYISEEVYSADLNTKLKEAAIGVVNEEQVLTDEYGFSSQSSSFSSTRIQITDGSHYITSSFGLGALRILKTASALHVATGTLAPGAQVLVQRPLTTQAALVVLNTGDTLWGGGTAAGRRVHLPWGSNAFDVNLLNVNGLTLMRRSIDWAAGFDT